MRCLVQRMQPNASQVLHRGTWPESEPSLPFPSTQCTASEDAKGAQALARALHGFNLEESCKSALHAEASSAYCKHTAHSFYTIVSSACTGRACAHTRWPKRPAAGFDESCSRVCISISHAEVLLDRLCCPKLRFDHAQCNCVCTGTGLIVCMLDVWPLSTLLSRPRNPAPLNPLCPCLAPCLPCPLMRASPACQTLLNALLGRTILAE